MRRITSLCIGVLMVCGCSHMHNLGSMSEEESGYFRDRCAKKTCSIRTYDGRIYDAANLHYGRDTASWIDLRTGESASAPVDQIYQVVFESKAGGFGDGFGTGFVIGASIGGVLGYLGGEDCSEGSYFCISREGGALLGVLFIGVPAGVVGGLIGATKGSSHVYYSSTVDSTRGTTDPGSRFTVGPE